jgi:uncharacterized membrane protein
MCIELIIAETKDSSPAFANMTMSNVANLRRHQSQLALLTALAFATLVCAGFFALRVIHFQSFAYRYLLWNLFLAWLPLLGALAVYNLHRRRSWIRWLLIAAFAIFWLAFFPNAPYLITDIMHLRQNSSVPLWFDLLLFVAFAWTGFFLGLVSLLVMQEIVRKTAGRTAGWIFSLGVLVISSFGIYLGRFWRWNSWDLFLNPGRIFMDVTERVQDPFTRLQAMAFSVLFSCFFLAMYLALVALTHFHGETRAEA